MHSFLGKNGLIHSLSILIFTSQFMIIFRVPVTASSVNEGSFALTQNIVWPIATSVSILSYSGGDFNGDGFQDIAYIFSDYNANYGSTGSPFCGTVYVIFGIGIGLLNADLSALGMQGIWISGQNNDWLASAITFGDINGDHIDDLIVGAANTDRIYVIFGAPGISDTDLSSFIPSPTQGILITGVTGSQAGQSLTTGDFNHDGIDDLAIAATAYNSNQGIVYVIFGSSSGFPSYTIDLFSSFASTIGFQIFGATGADSFGLSLNSRRGDVNNDGIDDLIIGTQNPPCPSSSGTCGMAVVIYGSTTPTFVLLVDTLTPSQGIQIVGANGAAIGTLDSINIVGDLNNDGIDDLAFGAPSFSPSSALLGAGLTFMVYGKAGGFTGNIDLSMSFEGFTIMGNIADGCFGQVITAGDMNHDGLSDLIISAPAPYITDAGRVYVFFGNKNGFSDMDLSSLGSQVAQVLVVDGDTGSASLGLSLVTPKDYDGDGVNDIVMFGFTEVFILYGSNCGRPDCSSLSSNPICYASAGCACGQLNLYFEEDRCVTQCSEDYSLDTNAPICEFDPSAEIATPLLVNTAAALTVAKTSTSIATVAINFFAFANPGPVVILSLSQVFVALKLLKINYPPRLAYLLQNSESQNTIFAQITNPPDALTDHITSYPLDEKFEEAGFDSSFLVNFWSDLISIIGPVALLLFVIFINFFFSPSKIIANTSTKRIARWLYFKLRQAVKWNLLISTFTGFYGNISLFTSLQMKTTHFDSDSVLEWISFVLCVLINIAVIALQIISLKVVSKLRKAHHQSQQKKNPKLFEKFKQQLKGLEVLFETFKEKSFLQQNFLFIFNIKIYIFWTVISYSPNYPLVPTLLNSIIGLFMVLYLILVRPHKEIIELINFILAEIIYEIMNVCTLLLVLDENDNWNLSDSRATIGDIIIVCNCIFMVLVALSSVIQILFITKNLHHLIKEWQRQRKVNTKVLDPSITNKIKSKPQENLENSHSLNFDPSMDHIHAKRSGSPFERSQGRQFRRNRKPQGSLIVYQNQDDSEIIQISPNLIGHRDKTNIHNGFENNFVSKASKIREINLSGKINTHFHKKRLQRTTHEFQDRGEMSDFDSPSMKQIYRAPTQPSPAKIIRTRRLDN